MLDEMLGLGGTRCLEREEVVGADGDTMLACLGVIVGIELIGYGNALGTLDKDKRDGVVGLAVHILVVFLA